MSSRSAFAVGAAGGFLAGRALTRERLAFARLSGSSIAGPSAAGWITDFVNTAYYRRPPEERDVDDLRLAFAVLNTYWRHQGGRRLRGSDLALFNASFARDRFFDTQRSPRGTLSRGQLLEGAQRLIGDWFCDAYGDDARRGWGMAFPTPEERASYDPSQRLALARLGPLTPGIADGPDQTWHTYEPVEMPSVDAVVEALTRTETWPDYATELGRFTPLRDSPLPGQTFEIEVAAGTEAGRPVFQRGYVTITRMVTRDDQDGLRDYFDELEAGLARFGSDEPRAVPEGGEPIVGFDLTTHEGHFMGRGNNRLILYEHEGRTWARAAGTWDPMPWHLEQAYRRAGRDAQHAFWGQGGNERLSMLHQIARRLAA